MKERIDRICRQISDLTTSQLEVVEKIIKQFSSPYLVLERNEISDIITNDVLLDIGDTLRIHHCFSYEPFTKDKFEYALERTLNNFGTTAYLAPTGNPGHDIEINGVKVSLKTQADKNIREEKLHISKFMELGKGIWSDDPKDLENLLGRFLGHMTGYDRIFSLRCLQRGPNIWKYELVEIPKALLSEARFGTLRMMNNSSQMPKPGYCDVFDETGEIKFQLYFDGGSERKLQIKNLKKKLCIVHGTWSFERISIT